MEEPKIIINGQHITPCQAMTVRCALSYFAMSLNQDGLGDDEHGQKMCAAYLDRISEIFKLIGMP